MGLNARSSLDPRWTTHHRTVVAGFMTATVKVIRLDPTGARPQYDQNTKTWSNGNFISVFTGLARIQPVRNIRDREFAFDDTSRQNIEIEINSIDTGINNGDILTVTNSMSFPELETMTFSVRSTIGNSIAWNTTLIVEANLKREVPNGS